MKKIWPQRIKSEKQYLWKSSIALKNWNGNMMRSLFIFWDALITCLAQQPGGGKHLK